LKELVCTLLIFLVINILGRSINLLFDWVRTDLRESMSLGHSFFENLVELAVV
jgi:hypothetical protein